MLFMCVVQHTVVHQPWTRFLLFSLLSCDGSLKPAALQLLTLVTHTLSRTDTHTHVLLADPGVCVCVCAAGAFQRQRLKLEDRSSVCV